MLRQAMSCNRETKKDRHEGWINTNKETYRKVWILDIQTVRKNYDWEKDWTNRQADEKIDKKCALKDWHKICTDKNKRHQARNKYRTHRKVEKETGWKDGQTEG